MKVQLSICSLVFLILRMGPRNLSRLMTIIDAEFFSKKEWDKKLRLIVLDRSSRDMSSKSTEGMTRMVSP